MWRIIRSIKIVILKKISGEFFFLTRSFGTYIISWQEAKRYFKFSRFGHFCDEHRIDASVGSSSNVSRVAWMCVFGEGSMVVYPFLGQGPFCLHVLSLGNKGRWIVLERGQMAGFLPAGRLPDLRRPAPGCPAAWSLAPSWMTWSLQLHREGCAFVLSFNLEKNGYL